MSAEPHVATASGVCFRFLRPDPADVRVGDIAHHLSLICRFGGAVSEFYSVASHSVFVSELLPPRLKLQGLLHDAPEAYLGDVVRPLKAELPGYAELERGVWLAVAARFGLPAELDELVKYADEVALLTERRDLLPWAATEPWQRFEARPAAARLRLPDRPAEAEARFLAAFLAAFRALYRRPGEAGKGCISRQAALYGASRAGEG